MSDDEQAVREPRPGEIHPEPETAHPVDPDGKTVPIADLKPPPPPPSPAEAAEPAAEAAGPTATAAAPSAEAAEPVAQTETGTGTEAQTGTETEARTGTGTEAQTEAETEAEAPRADGEAAAASGGRPKRRLTGAGALIAVLIALLGFTLVVQLRSNSTDPTLAAQRQEDLVRILSDLEAKDKRLRDDISRLENSQRELSSGAQGREAALQAATERADELGILAGTLAAKGPGLRLRFEAVRKPIQAESLLDAVQELRGAQAEAMQIQGADGTGVRVIASTSFLDKDDDVLVDGVRLTGPYTITVIGDPETMRTALNIPGGVVESVSGAGGTVIFSPAGEVQVTALHGKPSLQYAKPVS